MNERIKLLADKVSDDISIREMPFKTWYDEFTEKFAELLLKDVAQFVEDKFDFCGDEIIIAEAVLKHFGVEE